MADFRNTKEGRNVAQKYADILHLSRPEPPVKYPRMALSNRAKIFSPFAALRGFDDEISSEGASKLLVKKVELSDEEKNTLSDKLLQVKKGMKVVVRYFVRSTESTGKYICILSFLSSFYQVRQTMSKRFSRALMQFFSQNKRSVRQSRRSSLCFLCL